MAHVEFYAHNTVDNGLCVCEYAHACTHMAYSDMHTGYTARAFLLLLFYSPSLSLKAGETPGLRLTPTPPLSNIEPYAELCLSEAQEKWEPL